MANCTTLNCRGEADALFSCDCGRSNMCFPCYSNCLAIHAAEDSPWEEDTEYDVEVAAPVPRPTDFDEPTEPIFTGGQHVDPDWT